MCLISMKMTVNYFSTKYTKHSAGCPSLPEHMRVKVCLMAELPCYVEWDGSLAENDDEWGNEEWNGGACNASKVSEGTSSDSKVENSEEHNQNGIDKMTGELCGWISDGEDCREVSSFEELNETRSSNVGTSSFVSSLIKDNNFGSRRPAMEQSTVLITEDCDQPRSSSRHIVPSEVEVIDVTTPSPVVCRSSFWGKKPCLREMNKERHVVPSEAEVIDLTSPSPLYRSSLWDSLVDFA